MNIRNERFNIDESTQIEYSQTKYNDLHGSCVLYTVYSTVTELIYSICHY